LWFLSEIVVMIGAALVGVGAREIELSCNLCNSLGVEGHKFGGLPVYVFVRELPIVGRGRIGEHTIRGHELGIIRATAHCPICSLGSFVGSKFGGGVLLGRRRRRWWSFGRRVLRGESFSMFRGGGPYHVIGIHKAFGRRGVPSPIANGGGGPCVPFVKGEPCGQMGGLME
jgi:hypothetical protein